MLSIDILVSECRVFSIEYLSIDDIEYRFGCIEILNGLVAAFVLSASVAYFNLKVCATKMFYHLTIQLTK